MCLKCKAKQHPGMQPSGSKQQIVWHASNRSKNQWFIFRLHPNNAQPYSQVKKCMKINGRETTYVPECWKIQEHEYLLWHLQQNCGSWSHPTHRDMAGCIFMPPSPPPGAAYQKCRKKYWNSGFFDFWIIFCLSKMVLGVRRGLQMILSHMAPSCFNMSPSRAIWTHFKSKSVMFIEKYLGPGPGSRLGTWSWSWPGAGPPGPGPVPGPGPGRGPRPGPGPGTDFWYTLNLVKQWNGKHAHKLI